MTTDNLGSGAKRIDPFSKDTDVGAVVNLLVPARKTVKGQRVGNTGIETPDRGRLESIGNDLASQITNSMNLCEMLPDIELIKRLLVSSIISPQDMVSTTVSFASGTTAITGTLYAEMLKYLTDYFTEQYKVKDILPKALENALFTHGSYPLAVIPESGLDSLINKGGEISLESLTAWYDPREHAAVSSGLLGYGLLNAPTTKPTTTVSFESMFTTTASLSEQTAQVFKGADLGGKVTVVDNVNALKFPGVAERVRQNAVTKALIKQGLASSYGEISLESYLSRSSKKDKNAEIVNQAIDKLTHNRQMRGNVSVALYPTDTYRRTPVGHPLVMTLPPESLIPVHVPGNPEQHIAYFLLLDEYGNPIHRAKGSDYYQKMKTSLADKNDGSANHRIVSTIYNQISGGGDWSKVRDSQQFYNSYATAVQADLINRLKTGKYNTGVELAKNNELYRIMLARQLANMGTQILFIPAELVTYIAFDYDDHGMGRSLVDKAKILGTIRAAVMFSNTMAALRKATPAVNLNIELDPDDQAPQETVNALLHEFSKTRSTTFLFDSSNPQDIVNHIVNANISTVVTGNPNYPETKVSQEDRQQVGAEIDTDYEDDLRKRYIQAMGMLPDLIDNSQNVEFAQSIVSGNLMMAKQIKMLQDVAVAVFSDHLQKYVYNSGHLMRDLLEVVVRFLKELGSEDYQKFLDTYDLEEENLDDTEKGQSENKILARLAEAILFDFVDNFGITLPEPDVAKFESQAAALEEYIKVLDQTLPAYVEQAMVQGVFQNEAADSAEAYTKAVRAYFIRDWLRRNNMMQELEILCKTEDDDQSAKTVAGEVLAHAESVQRSLEEFATLMQKNARDFTRRLEKEKQSEDELMGTTGDSGSTDSSDGMDGGGGDDFGGDFGGDDTDSTADDTATDDAASTDATEADGTEEESSEEPATEEPVATEETEEAPKEDGDAADTEKAEDETSAKDTDAKPDDNV